MCPLYLLANHSAENYNHHQIGSSMCFYNKKNPLIWFDLIICLMFSYFRFFHFIISSHCTSKSNAIIFHIKIHLDWGGIAESTSWIIQKYFFCLQKCQLIFGVPYYSNLGFKPLPKKKCISKHCFFYNPVLFYEVFLAASFNKMLHKYVCFNIWRKQADCTGCRRRPFLMQVNKLVKKHPLCKISATLMPLR